MKLNDESFDLEIGLYDPLKDKFLVTSMNAHLDFEENRNYLSGKMDYAYL